MNRIIGLLGVMFAASAIAWPQLSWWRGTILRPAAYLYMEKDNVLYEVRS
jgi:hypothetical protein